MAISLQRLTIYLYCAHRAVVFAIAQLSCHFYQQIRKRICNVSRLMSITSSVVVCDPTLWLPFDHLDCHNIMKFHVKKSSDTLRTITSEYWVWLCITCCPSCLDLYNWETEPPPHCTTSFIKFGCRWVVTVCAFYHIINHFFDRLITTSKPRPHSIT